MRTHSNYRTTRLRLGSRRAASARARSCTKFTELVDAPVAGLPPITVVAPMTVTPTTESGYAIVIDGDLGPFDAAHSYALALGAAFDHDFLTDDDRSRFSAAIGATGRPWLSQRYADSPAAAFAHAFARLSCNGPWRDDAWRGAYWTPEAEGHVLYTCRAVIQEADNRRSGTLAI